MKKYIISERTDLFEPAIYISIVAELSGSLDVQKITDSVKAAYKANEATMSRIVMDCDGGAYYDKMEKSGCRVIVCDKNWRDIIIESQNSPFHINEGELVRTFISDNRIVIHAHHLAGDGLSIIILLKDIIKALDGEKLKYKPIEIIDRNLLRTKTRLRYAEKLLIRDINRKWKRIGKSFSWSDYYTIHSKYRDEHSSEIKHETLDIDEVKESCLSGVTVNSYIVAKMLKNTEGTKTVGIPVSIRENNQSMSNQVSGIAVKYRYNTKKTFEANAIALHRIIHKLAKNPKSRYWVLRFISELSPSLIDAVLLQVYGCYDNPISSRMSKIMRYTEKNKREIGITNLGVIDIEKTHSGFDVEDVFFIPPKVTYSRTVTGVCTFGNKLHICRNIVNGV